MALGPKIPFPKFRSQNWLVNFLEFCFYGIRPNMNFSIFCILYCWLHYLTLYYFVGLIDNIRKINAANSKNHWLSQFWLRLLLDAGFCENAWLKLDFAAILLYQVSIDTFQFERRSCILLGLRFWNCCTNLENVIVGGILDY